MKKQGLTVFLLFADVIIISQDLFKIAPNQIGKTKVLMTMVGGKAVYQDSSWEGK